MSHSGLTGPIAYRDIPDLDSGRIPFPMSAAGHYAVGERKTVLVFSYEITDVSALDQSIRSLVAVLSSPTNRLFLDVVLFSQYPEERTEQWKGLFSTLQDCPIILLTESTSTLQQQLMQYLEIERVEQCIVITVDSLDSLHA